MIRILQYQKKLGPPKSIISFHSFTWPQSQSVHKAVSLRPEKLKKKKKLENQTNQ